MTHRYRGRNLTANELVALPECKASITADNVRARISQGWSAEDAILTNLGSPREVNAMKALRLGNADNLERARVIKLMSVSVKETSTPAYYVIGAIEARKQIQLVNNDCR